MNIFRLLLRKFCPLGFFEKEHEELSSIEIVECDAVDFEIIFNL